METEVLTMMKKGGRRREKEWKRMLAWKTGVAVTKGRRFDFDVEFEMSLYCEDEERIKVETGLVVFPVVAGVPPQPIERKGYFD